MIIYTIERPADNATTRFPTVSERFDLTLTTTAIRFPCIIYTVAAE